MAKQNAQQVLVDVKAEAQASGANEVSAMADAIMSIGGAASVTSEQLYYLESLLETLRNSKGTAFFGDIATQLNASAKAFETLYKKTSSQKRVSSTQKRAYTENTTAMLATIAQIKNSNNAPLSPKEKKAFEDFTNAFTGSTAFINEMGQEAKRIADEMKKAGDFDGVAFKNLAESLEFIRRYANQFEINRARNADTRRTERTNAKEQAIEDRIKSKGKWDDYLDIKARNRVRSEYVKEIGFERAERNALRRNNYGTSLGEGIRQGLLNNEEILLRSGGVKGFAARLGGTLLQNTKLGNAFSGGITGAGINLGAFAGAGVVASVGLLGKGIWELSKASVAAYENIEKVKTNLSVVYGTQGEADSVFGEISKYAIKSPFGVKDVAEQATILKQSGVAEYELMPVLKNLGDLAGGNTEKMNRLANAVSQIAANGTATQRQLRMFTMAGVPIYQSIADVKGISKSDVLSAVKKGEVSYDDIVKALNKLTEEGGPFYKAVEKGARTLSARKQNLADIKELAAAETAATKNLGLYSPASISMQWTEFQEDFWQGIYESRKDARINQQVKDAEKTESQIDQIDSMIAATNPEDVEQLRYLKVIRMEVESMSSMSKDQREAALAEGYIYQNEKLLNAQNSLLEAEKLADRLNSKTSFAEKEAIAEYLKTLGVDVFRTAVKTTPSGETFYKYEVDYSKLVKIIKDATKDFKALSPRAQTAAFNVSNRALFKEVAQRPLGKEGQSTLEYVKGLYENSVQAKEEQKAQEEEKKQELKNIYDEMKEMGLSDANKFGFMNKQMSAAEAVGLVSKYTYNTGDSLDLDKNSEKFKESFAILTENIEALGPAFLNGVADSKRDFKAASLLLKKIIDPKEDANIQRNIKNLEVLIKGLDGPARELGLMMLQSRAHLDIDEKYLDFEEKGGKSKVDKYTFDTSYASLIRELSDKYLGVSLWRTLGGEFNTQDPSKFSWSVMKYFNNNNQRQLTGTIINGLLNQRGSRSLSWKDVASYINQSPEAYYKRHAQAYIDGSGNVVSSKIVGGKETVSRGRFAKGYIDFDKTSRNLTNLGVSQQATAATVAGIANQYETILKNIDAFFIGGLTEKEKEASQKYIEKKSELDQLGNFQFIPNALGYSSSEKMKKDRQNQEERFKQRRANLEKEVAELAATSGVKQLGIEENEEYRLAVTAISYRLKSLDDGTKSFREVFLEALDQYREQLKATYALTNTLAEFKTSIEKLENSANTSQNNAIAYSLLKSNMQGTAYEESYKKIVSMINNPENDFIRNSEDYKGLSNLQLAKKLITNTNKGSVNYTLSEYAQQNNDANSVMNTFFRLFGEKEAFLGGKYLSSANVKDYVAKGYITQQQADSLFDKNGKMVNAESFWNEMYQAALEEEETIKAGMDKEAALLGSILQILNKTDKAVSAGKNEAYAKYEQNLNSDLSNIANNKFNLFAPNFSTYGSNDLVAQRLIEKMGFAPTTEYKDLVADKYLEKNAEGGLLVDEMTGYKLKDPESIKNLTEEMKKYGLSTKDLEGVGENGIFSGLDLDALTEGEKKLMNIKVGIREINKACINLSKSMLQAFDSTIVSGISDSMVTLGESMRDGVDASEEIGKNLKNQFTELLKNIGPQMTQTGLAIAAAGAQEGKSGWGKVATGLALAAAGGFMSFAGGWMSEKGEDDDEDAQKEARLKSLADILSDLIAQAKTDAEYYEKNVRHRMAISTDEGVSSKSVNDMIITPQGNFSTHPDDYIIATKKPNELNGGGGSSPNVTISIYNQSGDVVKVAKTEKTENEFGDVDIKATIVAVTADAVVNGELDSAFAQMQARQQGVSRSY